MSTIHISYDAQKRNNVISGKESSFTLRKANSVACLEIWYLIFNILRIYFCTEIILCIRMESDCPN